MATRVASDLVPDRGAHHGRGRHARHVHDHRDHGQREQLWHVRGRHDVRALYRLSLIHI